MSEYHVIARDDKEFQLVANNQVLGHIRYPKWYSLKAVITLPNGTTLQMEPRGFWGTTFELKSPEHVLLTLKMSWSGNITLQSELGGSQTMLFKNKSLLKGTYVLHNEQEQELLVVQPNFKWKKLDYTYTITTTELLENFGAKELLVLVAVHCAKYYLRMVAAAAA